MDAAAETTSAPVAAPIRIFLVDDHELVRRGLRDVLEAEPDFEVVGEAGTATDAVNRILATRPDVAILDVRLPDGNGIDVCRQVRSALPQIRCLVLTSYDDSDAVFAAVMAGAAGYVLKEVTGSYFAFAIREVAHGKTLIDPSVTEQLLSRLRDGDPSDRRLASLTDREREVLGLIADGLTNRQIGERLFLAEKTVKNYVSGVLGKLGMERRTQAAVYAAELQRTGTSQ
jgi:two-component system response regulator DevR